VTGVVVRINGAAFCRRKVVLSDSVAIWGESCVCTDLDTERREKEKDASYI